MAELTMERFLKWKVLPRVMMGIMTYMYIHVLFWFMETHDKGLVTTEATALTATVTGAMTGAFAVWLGHEK